MTEQNAYNKEQTFKDMNKYFLAAYAAQKLEEGSPEGELIGKVHLTKNCDLEGLLDITGLDKTPMEAINVHSSIYYSKLNQLKISDALDHFKAPAEVKGAFAKYSGRAVEDLFKGFSKYKAAKKRYDEAKTPEESAAAFMEKNSCKNIAEDYSSIIKLSSYWMAENAASDIANYQRKQLAKKYARN